MNTIKEFASLCGCSAQTLRYYDRIDLLKPVKVDPWSAYRYYNKSQAIDFIKIKNLQDADFTIEEIKTLLTLPDQQVCEAFEQKIAEQSLKLERIKKIQRSYLTEKKNMEKLILNVADYLLHAITNYEILTEFVLSPAEGSAIIERLRAYIEQKTRNHLPAGPNVRMILDGQVFSGAERVADAVKELKEKGYDHTVLLGDEAVSEEEPFTPENYEIVWTHHRWDHVHEFIKDIPVLSDGHDYCFHFCLTNDSYIDGMEFPMFMIAAMLIKTNADDITMGCQIEKSTDGENHFELLMKR